MNRLEFEGLIAGAAFSPEPSPEAGSPGETVVAGVWRSSPFGSFIDVMWVRGDGERVLLAPSPPVGEFLTSVYEFDRAEVVAVRGGWDGETVRVEAGPICLWLRAGRRDWRSWLFALRPRPLLRLPHWIALEDRIARPLVGRLLGGAPGVRAAGRAPGGQREWYGIRDYRPLVEGHLLFESRDAGRLVDLPAGLGIGLSAFPLAPAVVHVLTTIEVTAPGQGH
ncbi:MAG: hypothetical protein M3N32_06645 [Actinomycetota bacterium]|nr:hypothetical protein [Actinomycetota bacterium]